MNLEEQVLGKRERAMAWSRVGFSLVAIGVVHLSPGRPPWFPVLADISLFGFLFYGVILLYLLHRYDMVSGKMGVLTTALDLIWVSLIVLSIRGSRSPFFVFYLFPIVTAGFRYGLRGSLPVAFLGVVIYGMIRYFSLPFRPVALDTFFIRCAYLLALAYIFGYLSEFEKKQAQKLMALSKTAGEAAVQEERRRIAGELHDRLLQVLASLALRLEACRKHFLQNPQELSGEIASMEDSVRGSMGEIKLFLSGKAGRELVPGTLVERLREEMKFLRDGLGLRVIFNFEPEEMRIPEGIERELYYVYREGLMNVARHSQASDVEVSLRRRNSEVVGALVDNGVGFDLDSARAGSHYGLAGMEERIRKLRGIISIESAPGKGTRVRFSVPVGEERRDEANSV